MYRADEVYIEIPRRPLRSVGNDRQLQCLRLFAAVMCDTGKQGFLGGRKTSRRRQHQQEQGRVKADFHSGASQDQSK